MKIIDKLFERFYNGAVLRRMSYVGGWCDITAHRFGDTIFRNIVEILTDLTNDVVWSWLVKGDNMKLAEFRSFYERDSRLVLWRVFRYGYAVIGINDSGFMFVADENRDYTKQTDNNAIVVNPMKEGVSLLVVTSEVYEAEGKSDYEMCRPFIEFIDNTFNASNTLTSRLGAFIVASPSTPNGAPAPVKLSPEAKELIEKDMAREYGALSGQRQIMVLPNDMKFQTISLVDLDTKMTDKVRMAILAICDRIKVPANQVAIIDAESSKSLSNGSELLAGDLAKYKSFERMLNQTFVKMARELGMVLTYNVYNKNANTNNG